MGDIFFMTNRTDKAFELSLDQQQELLGLAAAAIRYGLVNKTIMPVNTNDYDPDLQKPRACFVTLTRNEQLRGCIGSLDVKRALLENVIHNAWQAAFNDPRFPDVKHDELDSLHISISALTAPTTMQASSEQDLLSQLRPGVDGLIIDDGLHRATFLPSVWHQLPQPDNFIRQLKIKAGINNVDWLATTAIKRYTCQEFGTDISA